MKKAKPLIVGVSLVAVATLFVTTFAAQTAQARGGGVIYVTSQGLYFDTMVTRDPLPFKGPFQYLNPDGPNGPETEYGPGDAGYLGGRWWVDENGNGEMDPEDHFFLCPLLGPGREEP